MDPILLETERLRLRQFTPADLENLVALDSDPEVIRYTNAFFHSGGRPADRATVEAHTLPNFLDRYAHDGRLAFWAAEDPASGAFYGWFQFTPTGLKAEAELGFRLIRAVWGQGIATEGARALVERGFRDWGIKRVIASALLANRASIRVLEKAGLRRIGLFTHDPGGPAAQYALEWLEYLAIGESEMAAPEDQV